MANTPEMIRIVAIAICRATGSPESRWPAWRDEARAAIAAMRDPTKEMLARGAEAIDDATDTTTDSYETYIITNGSNYALPGWQAMIDEALYVEVNEMLEGGS